MKSKMDEHLKNEIQYASGTKSLLSLLSWGCYMQSDFYSSNTFGL